jgi:hypothetical protein
MTLPTSSGLTFLVRSASMKCAEGGVAKAYCSRVDVSYKIAPFSATIASKSSSSGKTVLKSLSSLPVTRIALRPLLLSCRKASSACGAAFPFSASVPS